MSGKRTLRVVLERHVAEGDDPDEVVDGLIDAAPDWTVASVEFSSRSEGAVAVTMVARVNGGRSVVQQANGTGNAQIHQSAGDVTIVR